MAGSVRIVLDRERELRLDINAISDASEVAGRAVASFLSGETRDIAGVPAIRALLWACLRRQDKRLTLDRVGDLIHQYVEQGGTLFELFIKISEAWQASGLAGKNGKPEAAEDPLTSGNGSTSQDE